MQIDKVIFDPIEIEVDCYGRNDYRFLREGFYTEQSVYDFFFDLKVYANSEEIESVEPSNIVCFSDYGPVKMYDTEYEHIHDQITNSITIVTWN